jgi:hypothetical protein
VPRKKSLLNHAAFKKTRLKSGLLFLEWRDPPFMSTPTGFGAAVDARLHPDTSLFPLAPTWQCQADYLVVSHGVY